MSYAGLIPGSTITFQQCRKPHPLPMKPVLEPYRLHLCFDTHVPKESTYTIRTRFGSSRARPKSPINTLCMPSSGGRASYYELLGVSESGTHSEIKQAYKQLARKYHPDVSPADCKEENTRRFVRVHEAYETLSDPQSRALYDTHLATGLHLAFSARRRFYDIEGLDERSGRKNDWQSQLMQLKRRSMKKDSSENMSWGARVRKQRSQSTKSS